MGVQQKRKRVEDPIVVPPSFVEVMEDVVSESDSKDDMTLLLAKI